MCVLGISHFLKSWLKMSNHLTLFRMINSKMIDCTDFILSVKKYQVQVPKMF